MKKLMWAAFAVSLLATVSHAQDTPNAESLWDILISRSLKALPSA